MNVNRLKRTELVSLFSGLENILNSEYEVYYRQYCDEKREGEKIMLGHKMDAINQIIDKIETVMFPELLV